MKGRLDVAYFPAAAGGVVGNSHLSFFFLYPSVPQKCQPQKPDLSLENTFPDQQGFYGHLQVLWASTSPFQEKLSLYSDYSYSSFKLDYQPVSPTDKLPTAWVAQWRDDAVSCFPGHFQPSLTFVTETLKGKPERLVSISAITVHRCPRSMYAFKIDLFPCIKTSWRDQGGVLALRHASNRAQHSLSMYHKIWWSSCGKKKLPLLLHSPC